MICVGKLKFSPIFFVCILVCFTLLDFPIAAGMFLSLFLHEAIHILFMKVFNAHVKQIEFLPLGAKIVSENMPISKSKNIVIYLSAPIFNILIAFILCLINRFTFVPYCDFFVFYNVLIGVINLLPICPLDMSKALKMLFSMKYRMLKVSKIVFMVSMLTSSLVFLIGIFVWIKTNHILIVIVSCFCFYHSFNEQENDYSAFLQKNKKNVKTITVTPGETLLELLKKTDDERKTIFLLNLKNKKSLNEEELFYLIEHFGYKKKIGEIYT